MFDEEMPLLTSEIYLEVFWLLLILKVGISEVKVILDLILSLISALEILEGERLICRPQLQLLNLTRNQIQLFYGWLKDVAS